MNPNPHPSKFHRKLLEKLTISNQQFQDRTITTPHFKKVYRLYDRESGKAEADYLCVYDESVNDNEPLTIFDPVHTWKEKTLTNYRAEELLKPIFISGKLVYERRSVKEIRDFCAEQINTLWDEVTRFENPHNYYVDLSKKLWDIKHELLKGK